jgi:hypothetical protein
MRFALKPIVVKMTPVGKVCMVFPVKAGMIVIIIGAVVIVAMPCRIIIISVSRVSRLVDANLHTNLCAGGIDCHGGCYDHGKKK